MKLQEFMIKEVVQAGVDESISTAAQRMRERAVGCLVVTVAGTVKGIITDRDLLDCLAQAHDPYQCKIAAHMRRPVTVLRPEEEHATAARVMQRKRIKRIPVALGGKLLGIISLSDLAVVASQEALWLRLGLNFFTSVVEAQSAQHNLPRPANTVREEKATMPESANKENGNALLDVGGPG
jgi:signal-transduction protein with cAMP-binding, CBS, and nucleotidyltransferase domain